MKDMFKMMQNAASMRKKLKKIQRDLRKKTVDFTAQEGKIKVTARGDTSIADIHIDPSLLNPDNSVELEKELVKAVDGALDAAKQLSANEMKGISSQMGLPDIPGM
jgi:nucleoid-associated protein EbfC